MPVVRIKRPGYSGVHGADRPGVFGVEDLQWNKRMESTVSALIEWHLVHRSNFTILAIDLV